ncbi:hypothetical protein C1J00_02440 [Streptomyces cahuitamycinicus]|uniref:Uncharacterized protein n=1 Tax=Streptomyces cahuitamycinicus TaxID=2070367 RepID=A0A2N8TXE7_9ACTN|nr:hypothetical protein C1J00_02440 [Streptomyces cahuitamycinicus]
MANSWPRGGTLCAACPAADGGHPCAGNAGASRPGLLGRSPPRPGPPPPGDRADGSRITTSRPPVAPSPWPTADAEWFYPGARPLPEEQARTPLVG